MKKVEALLERGLDFRVGNLLAFSEKAGVPPPSSGGPPPLAKVVALY